MSKQKENQRKMCTVGKVCVILDYLKKKIISSISQQTSARSCTRAETQSTMGSMYDVSAAIFAKDIGLGQIFLIDRVADLARTI